VALVLPPLFDGVTPVGDYSLRTKRFCAGHAELRLLFSSYNFVIVTRLTHSEELPNNGSLDFISLYILLKQAECQLNLLFIFK
jgi:hypothetical protein